MVVQPRPTYLAHLDGLRALALIGVLAFHFDTPHLHGGYLGVDVFLVLSGYLITRNIVFALGADTFSLRAFYISRIWRLLPAALATILATLSLAFLIFPPQYSSDVCKSALAAAFSVSNVWFYLKVGYFDTDNIAKPLLHTWSLSLEGFFYSPRPIFPYLSLFAAISSSAISSDSVLPASYSFQPH